jgi:hypothetical protein
VTNGPLLNFNSEADISDFYEATPFRNPPKRENCTPGYSLHKLSFAQCADNVLIFP